MVNKTEQLTLLIDAGNSAIKWALSGLNGLSDTVSQSYPETITSDFFTKQWTSLDKPLKVIVSCVASEIVWQGIQNASHELWNIDVDKVTSLKQGFGLINAYEKADDLGSDRWCAMIGANQLAKSAFIVIDAGSAVTIDMVNESGKHMGGYITPGLNLMRQSLGLHTAQVNVEAAFNSRSSLALASSTTECVEAGIHLSVVKLIEAVYQQESKQGKKLKCFLTGGSAALIAESLAFECVIAPDLVLRGLAKIAA